MQAISDVLWDGGAVGFFPEPNGTDDDDEDGLLSLGGGITSDDLDGGRGPSPEISAVKLQFYPET